jgi:hypothetical protein
MERTAGKSARNNDRPNRLMKTTAKDNPVWIPVWRLQATPLPSCHCSLDSLPILPKHEAEGAVVNPWATGLKPASLTGSSKDLRGERQTWSGKPQTAIRGGKYVAGETDYLCIHMNHSPPPCSPIPDRPAQSAETGPNRSRR